MEEDQSSTSSVDIRLALAENDIEHLQKDLVDTVHRLDRDISDTRAMLANVDSKIDRMDYKLDEAIKTALRGVPGWVQVVVVALVGMLGAAVALIAKG